MYFTYIHTSVHTGVYIRVGNFRGPALEFSLCSDLITSIWNDNAAGTVNVNRARQITTLTDILYVCVYVFMGILIRSHLSSGCFLDIFCPRVFISRPRCYTSPGGVKMMLGVDGCVYVCNCMRGLWSNSSLGYIFKMFSN